MVTRIALAPEAFSRLEQPLVEADAGAVTTFRYASGVEALRVRTDRLELVVLPFVGQQIWRLVVDREDLTMRTMFDEPLDVPLFGLSYGAFMMHCGLSAMGNPGPDDTHPPHGELPLARYRSAAIEVGSDEAGPFLCVTGEFVHRVSHSLHYGFTPRITVRPGSPVVDLLVLIENRRRSDFDYQYLCHVNWAHGPGTLIQSVPMSPDHFVLYPADGADAETRRYTDAIAVDPMASNWLTADDHIVPEYVALTRPLADHDGWAHYLMVRPDGRAAWVAFDVADLPYGIRWISRTADEAAAGFCLPCTSHHMGRTRAAAEGMLRRVPPDGRVEMRVAFGLLDSDVAAEMRSRIEAVLESG